MKAQEKRCNEMEEMRVRIYYYGLIGKLGRKRTKLSLDDASLLGLLSKIVKVCGESLKELFKR